MSLKNELLDYKEKILKAVEAYDADAAATVDSEMALQGWSTEDVDEFVQKNTMVFHTWQELVER